jgi:alanine racemase
MEHVMTSAFHHRPTRIEVCEDSLANNARRLQDHVGSAKIMAVVKANGYGHGLVSTASILIKAGIDSLGVAYIEEAVELRRAGIGAPILVFGGLLQDQLDLYLEHNVDVTASSVSKLEQIEESAIRVGRQARVHLKIDTGLERIGTHYYSSEPLFEAALKSKSCDIVGVYSHFADVNSNDNSLAKLQLERFLECLRFYEERADRPFMRHIANSAAILEMPESYLDMVRPGLLLYGVMPHEKPSCWLDLNPTLSLKSHVVYFKVIKEGAGVSYGHSWHAPCDTRIITIPLGYGDGFLRALSNRGSVLVDGHHRAIVGKICMDQLMVDLTPTGQAYNGDEVVLIGTQGDKTITVNDLARTLDTTPHEILVSLNQRIPRVLV